LTPRVHPRCSEEQSWSRQRGRLSEEHNHLPGFNPLCNAVLMEATPADEDRLLRRAEVLFLAGRDLWDVGLLVDYLVGAIVSCQPSDRVQHTLEVGTIVTYCRPFTGRRGRTITMATDLSPELSVFHRELIKRRNTVYAHTDHTDHRMARTFRSPEEGFELLRNFETGVVHEEWDSLSDNGFISLRELAAHHHGKVVSELDRLRAKFEDAGQLPG
jgi:hypothetical protein